MRTLILMASFFSAFGLFGAEMDAPAYNPAGVYDALRKQILELTAEKLKVSTSQPVLAVVMETGYPEAVATLVAVIDGSASLYFSNGGGIIGAGDNPEPNQAAKKLVAEAAGFLKGCPPTKVFPLPKKANTRFFLVTPKGILTAEAKEDDLGNDQHRLSPLFHVAHELITQIHLTEKKKKLGGDALNRTP